jgi:hypothetical protein
MSSDQQMWTPLEAALAPFKDLARLNRQAVTDAEGQNVQLVLRADRCRVRPAPSGTAPHDATIELGFSLGATAYAVHFVGATYRRGGVWEFGRIATDISAGLRTGELQPGAPFALKGSAPDGTIAG